LLLCRDLLELSVCLLLRREDLTLSLSSLLCKCLFLLSGYLLHRCSLLELSGCLLSSSELFELETSGFLGFLQLVPGETLLVREAGRRVEGRRRSGLWDVGGCGETTAGDGCER
jgi:hypothetical protein